MSRLEHIDAVFTSWPVTLSLWIPKLLLNLALFEHVLHDMVLLESLDQLQSLLDQWIRAVPTRLMTMMTRMKTMKMKTTRTTMMTLKNMKQHSEKWLYVWQCSTDKVLQSNVWRLQFLVKFRQKFQNIFQNSKWNNFTLSWWMINRVEFCQMIDPESFLAHTWLLWFTRREKTAPEYLIYQPL